MYLYILYGTHKQINSIKIPALAQNKDQAESISQ